ncbi:MAG TPA: DPP IV N-terminal domain-containing protein [Verrucomicrobiae bacterium]|nr:DPP IV N-terminal domain-containing protein [Verrucomicrobiae bacterium]
MRNKLTLGVAILATAAFSLAQDRLKTMPGYEQHQKMAEEMQGAFKSGALNVTWKDDTSFEYDHDGRRWQYDVTARKAADIGEATGSGGRGGRGGRGGQGGQGGRGGRAPGVQRGRQAASTTSPDGKWKAFYRDRNIWISGAEGENETAITTDGSERDRTKYGTGSWVYGEELAQPSAIWWAPDSKKVAFYRFDESKVPDYFLQMNQTKLQSTVDTEAYPKAGVDNPIVDVLTYDVATKRVTKLDVRDGQPFADPVVGYYVYHVGWTADSREVIFDRANRRQNVVELAACNPDSGKCRGVVKESWPESWAETSPAIHFLEDGNTFIWTSERNGFANLYLYDLSGKLHVPLTQHNFEVGAVLKVDEKAGVVYYRARDGENFMKWQLHRVGLDGKNDRRLTDPAFNHTDTLSPDGKYFVDVAQTHDKPPVTRLMDHDGKVIAELAASDISKLQQLGVKPIELFKFKAADGMTDLYGLLHFPSNFDPSKKYPMLVTVYAGPATNGANENFATPNQLTEYGFLVAAIDSRSAAGRGKKALDAIYLKFGIVEIDDQAAGVKSLWSRPYVDRTRVGIFGTSYGGYASAMALLRYPDVFAAASASSPVTDWRNYDTIYTERYMWTPQENKTGYDAGSLMNYADKLNGRLMLYYGTADNNVHPSNMMQLVQALQRAGKSFDLQVGPDMGHSGVNQQRMMEFFIQNLVR